MEIPYVLLLLTVVNYYYFRLLRTFLHQHTDPKTASYFISTLHAIISVLLNLYLVCQKYPFSSTLFYLHHGNTVGYCLLDLEYLINSRQQHSYPFSMMGHHLTLIGSVVSEHFFYLENQYNPIHYYYAMGVLAEASTPLLNYIQHHHGKVSKNIKYLFVVVYFLCRPINLTYCAYNIIKLLGWYDLATYFSIFFALLNYYWFYKIYQKSYEEPAKKFTTVDEFLKEYGMQEPDPYANSVLRSGEEDDDTDLFGNKKNN